LLIAAIQPVVIPSQGRATHREALLLTRKRQLSLHNLLAQELVVERLLLDLLLRERPLVGQELLALNVWEKV
jgi:hypothetical protein